MPFKREFQSAISQEHFEKNGLDALSMTILDMLGTKPIEKWDVHYRLEENGIPGYTEADITKALEQLVDLYEAIPTLDGYIKMYDDFASEEQMTTLFRRVHRPPARILAKEHKPRNHSYIESGVDVKDRRAIPVPPGSRVFVKLYGVHYTKYRHTFYSHVYAYKYKDGPIQPVDFWYVGEAPY